MKEAKLLIRDRYTNQESYRAEIMGIALSVIGLISFIGVINKSLNFQTTH